MPDPLQTGVLKYLVLFRFELFPPFHPLAACAEGAELGETLGLYGVVVDGKLR